MINRVVASVLFLILSFSAMAQGVVVDYNNPKKYKVGRVTVEGNNYFSDQQIIQQTGLMVGNEVTVPGEDISQIVQRLWLQRYFEDVEISIDGLSENRDSAYFRIRIKERPRVSRWTFSGVKSGEQKDLNERLSLRRGGEYSEYVAKTASDIITRFYKEKGFQNTKVTVQTKVDTVINGAIRVNFAVDRGEKIKVRTITFTGNEHVKDVKLAMAMKKIGRAHV